MTRKLLAGLALAGAAFVMSPTAAVASNPCVNAIAERDALWDVYMDAIRRCDNNNPYDGCPAGNTHVERAQANWYAAMLNARAVCAGGY